MANHVEGGERLRKWAQQWGKFGSLAIKVGFFKTAKYQAGLEVRGSERKGNLRSRTAKKAVPVAMVAAWNEFGTKPKRGGAIPERPFFRNTINSKSNHDKLTMTLAHGVDAKRGVLTRRGANQAGRQLVGMIQEEIKTLREPPNSERTIKWKESENPLIDTGHMRRSVSHQVEDNASRS